MQFSVWIRCDDLTDFLNKKKVDMATSQPHGGTGWINILCNMSQAMIYTNTEGDVVQHQIAWNGSQ